MPVKWALLAASILLLCIPAIGQASEQLWASHCAACHGVDGGGQTPMGKRLKLPDFRKAAVQKSLTDHAIDLAILNGVNRIVDGVAKMMPAYKQLSASQRTSLQKYVRRFKPSPPRFAPPPAK